MKVSCLGWGVSLLLLAAPAVHADSRDESLEKLHRIPSADPKHSELWPTIPRLILTDKGAFIFYARMPVPFDLSHARTPVPFDQVLKALADLPPSAWPCGRLIVFWPSPPGIHSRNDRPPTKTESEQVEADIKAAGIEMVPALSI